MEGGLNHEIGMRCPVDLDLRQVIPQAHGQFVRTLMNEKGVYVENHFPKGQPLGSLLLVVAMMLNE
jgi:hypothetical protein